MERRIGVWAFIGGMLLAILAGFNQLTEAWPVWVLAVLGLLVGWMNISAEETKKFLLSALALSLSAGAVLSIGELGQQISEILKNVITFTSAALLFVATRDIWQRLARARNYVIWAAGLGLLLAAFGALRIAGDIPIWILSSLGVLIGIIVASREEGEEGTTGNFIISALALQVSAGAFGEVPAIGAFLTTFFINVVAVLFAVLLVVAFVTVFRILDKL